VIAPDASTGRLQIALVLLATLAATVITATVVGLLPLQDAGVVPLAAAAALAALVIVGRRPRLVLVFGVVLYVAGFEWAYVSWVVPIFAYSGLIDVGVDQAAYLVVTVLAALPAVASGSSRTAISSRHLVPVPLRVCSRHRRAYPTSRPGVDQRLAA